ncbi:MAG: Na+/H+ antiporter subunit E [Myxococcota bacterium]
MNLYHVAALCLVVWLGLVGDLSPSTLAGGAATAGVGTLLFHRAMGGQSSAAATSLRAALISIPWFYLRFVMPGVVRGAWAAAWAPWRVTRLAPCILRLDLPGATEMSLALLAHGITLSPNEQVVAIDAPRGRLFVHVMDASDPERRRDALLHAHGRFLKGKV